MTSSGPGVILTKNKLSRQRAPGITKNNKIQTRPSPELGERDRDQPKPQAPTDEPRHLTETSCNPPHPTTHPTQLLKNSRLKTEDGKKEVVQKRCRFHS